MNPLNQMRRQLHQAWDNLAEGWRALMERAGHALTRFSPAGTGGEQPACDDSAVLEAPRWGLLAAELRNEPERIVVRVEAPGMQDEDFDIEVHKDALLVRGEKRLQRERDEGAYFLMECAYGQFERIIALPAAVESTGARATYKRGVLRVELPKQARSRTHKVRVKEA